MECYEETHRNKAESMAWANLCLFVIYSVVCVGDGVSQIACYNSDMREGGSWICMQMYGLWCA